MKPHQKKSLGLTNSFCYLTVCSSALLFILFIKSASLAQTAPIFNFAKKFSILTPDSIKSNNYFYSFGKIGSTIFIDSLIDASDSLLTATGSVQAAITELDSAIGFIGGQSGTALSSPITPQTLTAGIYSITGTAKLMSSLTLSGDSTSIFIFKISDSLVVDSGFVLLIDGVEMRNIYWCVQNKTIINENVEFSGTILCNADILSKTFNGGNLSILSKGVVSIQNNFPNNYKNYSHSWELLNWPNRRQLFCNGPNFICNYISNPSFEAGLLPQTTGEFQFGKIDCWNWKTCTCYQSTGSGSNTPDIMDAAFTPNTFSPCTGSILYTSFGIPLNTMTNSTPSLTPSIFTNSNTRYATVYNSESFSNNLTAPLDPTLYLVDFWARATDCFLPSQIAGAGFCVSVHGGALPPFNCNTTVSVTGSGSLSSINSTSWTHHYTCLPLISLNSTDQANLPNCSQVGFSFSYSNVGLSHGRIFVDDFSMVKVADAGPDVTTCGGPVTIGPPCIPSLSGGWSFYYNWSNGATISNPTVSPSSTTTYTVYASIVDGNGNTICDWQDEVIVTVGTSPITAAISIFNNPKCNGSGDGDATVTPNGTGYSFLWSNSQTTAHAVNLQAGTYTVTVTNSSGCSATASITLIDPTIITLTTSSTSFLCSSGTGGTATASPSGGTGTFIYSWNTIPVKTTQTITGLSTGTYIVTVTDGNGCTKTASSTVLASGNINVSCTSVSSTCSNTADGSATVSVSNGQSPYFYSWSNGSTTNTAAANNTISGLLPGTYYVTVTDNNGCTATSSIKVGFINLAPDNPIITGDCYACGGSHIYSVSNPFSSPYVYTWLIKRLGVTFASGNGSSTTSITIPGNTPIQVYFTVTSGNGCSATGTFDVYPCCEGTQTALGTLDITDIKVSDILNQAGPGQLYHNYIDNSGSTPWFYTNYGTGNAWDVVSINGTLTIDKNFQFAHAEIIMGPCAKIVILPGKTLSLTDILYLHGCGERMWDQIYISDYTATLEMIAADVRIEDGEQAIVSHDGGVYTLGNVNINFNKNWKSIVVQPYANPHQGTIRDATFNCVAWPNNPNTVTTLIRPHLGEKSFVGIEINNVADVTIGVLNIAVGTNYPGFGNKFYNLQNGIQAFGSGVTVINNEFKQIDGVVSPCKGCPIKGWAIYGDGQNLASPPLLRVGDGNYPFAANFFYNCNGGISIRNDLNAVVEKNFFTNIIPQPGSISNYPVIQAWNNKDVTLDILSNDIYNFNRGIACIYTKSGCTLNIQNNLFNIATMLHPNPPAVDASVAITIENTLAQFQAGIAFLCNVNSNSIYFSNTGIHLSNIRSNTNISLLNDIYFNQTLAPNKVKYGIRIDASDKITVDGNRIQSTTLPNSNYNLHLNGTLKGLIGINVQSGAYNTVSSNTCRKLGIGFRYYNCLSDNYTSCCNLDNNWFGGSIDNSNIGDQGSAFMASDNSWDFSLFTGPTLPHGLEAVGTYDPSDQWYCSSSGLPLFLDPLDLNPPGFQSFNSSGNPNTHCAAPLLQPDNDQERMVAIINEEGDFTELSETEKYNYKKSVFAALWFDNALMNMGTAYDVILQAFYDEMLQTPIGKLFTLGGVLETDTTQASNLISTISPTNLAETNERIIDEIYLVTWARSIYEFSPDQQTLLYNIAVQNPTTGGQVVYTARVMLEMMVDDYSDMEPGNRNSPRAFSFKKYHEVKLFPNPASTYVNCFVRFTETESGKLELFDGYGRMLQKQDLKRGYNDIKLNTEQLNNGIYYVRMISNNSFMYNGKFIISK